MRHVENELRVEKDKVLSCHPIHPLQLCPSAPAPAAPACRLSPCLSLSPPDGSKPGCDERARAAVTRAGASIRPRTPHPYLDVNVGLFEPGRCCDDQVQSWRHIGRSAGQVRTVGASPASTALALQQARADAAQLTLERRGQPRCAFAPTMAAACRQPTSSPSSGWHRLVAAAMFAGPSRPQPPDAAVAHSSADEGDGGLSAVGQVDKYAELLEVHDIPLPDDAEAGGRLEDDDDEASAGAAPRRLNRKVQRSVILFSDERLRLQS